MRGSIRTRLLVLVTAATLPLLVVAAVFLWGRFNEDFVETQQAAGRAAQLAATRIDDRINEVNILLFVIGKMVSTDPADAEKNDAIFRGIKASLPAYMNNVLLFDLKRTVLVFSSVAG